MGDKPMINLFSITKVISVLGIIYSVIIIIILTFSQQENFLDKVLVAIRYGALFEILLVGFFLFAWKAIWKTFPKLNDLLFPDINGQWDVEIHYKRKGVNNIKKAKGYIKQSFIQLSMEVITNESESETLTVQPQKDAISGRLHLFYIYRNTPNEANESEKYKRVPSIGTAILKSDPSKNFLFEGNYFTDINTKGTFRVLKKAKDVC